MSCPTIHTLEESPVSSSSLTCPRHRHLISGTFNSNLLHILSFDTLTRSLSLLSSLPAYGPHSFLTAGRTSLSTNRLADTVYATTWAEKPELCAFKLNWQNDELKGLEWLGNVPITATSSYVHVQPPPFDSITSPSYGVEPGPSRYLYSAGGPTGEIHSINPATGALEGKTQELIFLREGEKALAKADKTRVALRYGAHNVDIGKNRLAFIADVGRNSILTYKQDQEDGSLTMLGETFMPEEGDGPRHVVPSPCGKFAYSVTEHTSYVDVYRIEKEGLALQHLQRVSILPSSATSSMESIHQYRGDTVRLSPDGKFLFATTRGKESKTKGFVKVWQIEDDILQEKFVYETRNSGGKANAIEFAPRYAMGSKEESTIDYAVLTDDQEGFITILEWDGTDLRDVTSIQLPALENGQAQGASQAIWVA